MNYPKNIANFLINPEKSTIELLKQKISWQNIIVGWIILTVIPNSSFHNPKNLVISSFLLFNTMQFVPNLGQ